MSMQRFVGKIIDEPIVSDPNLSDLRDLWDRPRRRRQRGRMVRATTGETMPYTLLYYIPGLATYCGVHGAPILTGYMSGCFLFRFRFKGQLSVAHVGTDLDSAEFNTHAKAAWKTFADRPDVTDIFGFDPLADISVRLLGEAAKAGHPQVMGLFDGNGAARIAAMSNPGSGEHKGMQKKMVVGIEAAPLRPWSVIRNHKKFL